MRIHIKITLTGVENPIVWRTMVIPLESSFHQLHLYIQAAMGWKNAHLYSFQESPRSRFFTITSPYFEEGSIDATEVNASSLLITYLNAGEFKFREDQPTETIHYNYDFGDDWRHELEVLYLDRTDDLTPLVIDGAGACPPEDVGGVHGYAGFLDAISNPKMMDKDYKIWVKESGLKGFNKDAFDLQDANERIRRVKKKDVSLN